MAFLQAIVSGIVAIGLLVFIHEFGHFIVAKLFKVGVPVFSIGMGPRVWGFQWGGTDYRISALPVGGYVTLAGADPFGDYDPDALVDPEFDFMKKPIWQRLLVMFAGPAFNLALPLVVFTGVLMTGEPNSDTTIGTVLAHTEAERQGFEIGDTIVAVDGQPVKHWRAMELLLADYVGRDFTVTLERDGSQRDVTIDGGELELLGTGIVDSKSIGLVWSSISNRIGVDDPDSPAGKAGLQTGDYIEGVDGDEVETWHELRAALDGGTHTVDVVRPVRTDKGFATKKLELTLSESDWRPHAGDPYASPYGVVPALLMVGEVMGEMPAIEAGVLPNDRILSANGVPVVDFDHLMALVRTTVDTENVDENTQTEAIDLVFVRDGEHVPLSIRPKMYSEVRMASRAWRPIVGISIYRDSYVNGEMIDAYYSLPEAMSRASTETMVLFTNTLNAIGNLVTGGLPVRDGLGGPVAIFSMAAEGAKHGIHTYARFIGMISISLGLVNLLPVPVLDGGQILFYLVEGIRGRPLSVALRERLQMIGVLGLVALMIFVTVNDVNSLLERLFS